MCLFLPLRLFALERSRRNTQIGRGELFASLLSAHVQLLLFHRIIESLRLEKTSKIIKSNHQPNTTCLLNHVLKCHTYTFFEHLQGWWLHHFSGQPVQMLYHSVQKFFLISILNLPWPSLKALPLFLSLVTWEKRPTPASLQTPFR